METLQPKLRFPEFRDNWDDFILGKIATFSKGKGISKSDISENGKFECIRYGELYTVYGETISKIVSKTDLDSKDLIFSSYNDIIIPASGETQLDIATASCVLKDGVALGGDLNIIKTDNNGVFLSYYLNNSKKEDIASLAQGVSVVHLYSSQLSTLNIKLPSLKEQTKIANFLSSVDEKLNLLKEKKALLEDYKKGIMQKIFNQEIRFKDDNGNNFEDWIETNLGGICEFENGKAHENEIDENGDFVVVNSKFVSTNGRVRKYTNKIISRLDKNDIVMVMSDVPNGKAIAKCYYIEEDNKYSLNQRICKIRVINNDSKYIYYLINRNPYYLAFDSGVCQTNFKKDEVLDCPLYIPKDVKEQTKIANFLSAIDEKIELVSNQIQDTQEYKKGLLQQMFV